MATIVGLTGGIASGKSTVSKMLISRGFTIVDADIAAREVVTIGEPAYQLIVEAFGQEILYEDNSLNRQKLGSIIFQNEEKRLLLNSFVHPAVRQYMNVKKDEAVTEGKQTVFLDIPLLFESKLTHMVERTILVYVEKDVQVKRLMERNQLSKADALARIHSQMPLDEKVNLADAVINNNHSINETERQLDKIINNWELHP